MSTTDTIEDTAGPLEVVLQLYLMYEPNENRTCACISPFITSISTVLDFFQSSLISCMTSESVDVSVEEDSALTVTSFGRAGSLSEV
jgi:hypothetical protein